MDSEIKNSLLEVSKLIYDKGLVNAFEGNLSIKFEDKIYITPSAVCKGFLTEEMIVVTDLDGNIVEGGYKPSSEIRLHIACYKERQDIASVVHAHPPYSTGFAVANKAIETRAYPEMIVLYDKIPLVDYGTPSTDEIFQGLNKYIYDHDVVLLANHGVVSVGKDIYDAFFKLESVESIAKTLTIARNLGGEKELPQKKIDELYDIRINMKNKDVKQDENNY